MVRLVILLFDSDGDIAALRGKNKNIKWKLLNERLN